MQPFCMFISYSYLTRICIHPKYENIGAPEFVDVR